MASFFSKMRNAASWMYNKIKGVILAILLPFKILGFIIATPFIILGLIITPPFQSLWQYLGNTAAKYRFARLTKILTSEKVRQEYFRDYIALNDGDRGTVVFFFNVSKDPTEYLIAAFDYLTRTRGIYTGETERIKKSVALILKLLESDKVDIVRIFKSRPNLIIKLSEFPFTLPIIKYLLENPIVREKVFNNISTAEILNSNLYKGKTALFCACYNSTPDLVDYFLSCGANANIEGRPFFHVTKEKQAPLLAALTNKFFYVLDNWRECLAKLIESTDKKFIEKLDIIEDKLYGKKYQSISLFLSPSYEHDVNHLLLLTDQLIKAGAVINHLVEPSKTLLDVYNDTIAAGPNFNHSAKRITEYEKMRDFLIANGAKTYVELLSEPDGALAQKGRLANLNIKEQTKSQKHSAEDKTNAANPNPKDTL